MRKCVFLLVLLVLFSGCGGGKKPKYTNPNVLAEFTIAKGADWIFLPVRFKGKEYLFLLDTGSSHTIFDTTLKQELGKAKSTEKVQTAGGPMTIESFDAPEAFLGPFNLQDCGEVGCIDMAMLSLIKWKKVSGVIGLNFLKKYVMQIDFDRGKLLFLKPTKEGNPDWGEVFKIDYHPFGQPFISGMRLDGIKVDFVIDTGMDATGSLHRGIFKEIISEKGVKTSEEPGETASGSIQVRAARIERLSVGPFEYQDLIFHEGNMSMLGVSFLSRHTVTFDFPNSRIYLKKGKEFTMADNVGMSGLCLVRPSNETIVYSVDDGSPAQKAGIRANDVILKVGDKDVNTYERWELRELLTSGDKHKITMTIKRGDDVKEVSFLLKKKI